MKANDKNKKMGKKGQSGVELRIVTVKANKGLRWHCRGSQNTAEGREFLLKKGDRSCTEVVLSEVHRERKEI